MGWPEVVLDPLVAALQERRKHLDLTQTEVAARLMVNPTTINAWERGRKQPGLPNLHKWCAVLGVELGLWEVS